jgi:hypothetical protein
MTLDELLDLKLAALKETQEKQEALYEWLRQDKARQEEEVPVAIDVSWGMAYVSDNTYPYFH